MDSYSGGAGRSIKHLQSSWHFAEFDDNAGPVCNSKSYPHTQTNTYTLAHRHAPSPMGV